jgi:hypothetical protein
MSDDNQEQEEPMQINAEPIIAVFKHKSQYYVSTPETPVEDYYNALSALLFHMKQDTPTMFEELRTLINSVNQKVH